MTTTTAPEIETLDPLAAFDEQQAELEQRYRDLILRAAASQPFTAAEVHELTAATGRTLADFRQHVQRGKQRRAAAEVVEHNGLAAASQAEQQAKQTLDAAAAECEAELQALQQKHRERLQPLREAHAAARRATSEAGQAQQQACAVLMRTCSARIDWEIRQAHRAATEHQQGEQGLAKVLHGARRKLQKLKDENLHDATRETAIRRQGLIVSRLEVELEEFSRATPPRGPSEAERLRWENFDLAPANWGE